MSRIIMKTGQVILSFRIFNYAKSVLLFAWIFYEYSCCSTLKTHVGIEINVVCS